MSGVDRARQALLAAREAARKNGAARQKPKRRTTTVVRRDGREPLGLGSAIGMMMTERGMTAPAAGGSALADFDTVLTAVVPELAGRVRAAAFDAGTGPLDVVPDLPAAGTQLRWSAPKLIAAANEKVPGANVRALHVLAPASVEAGPATAVAEPAPPSTAPAAPMRRADPPEGYREAIAATAPPGSGSSTPTRRSRRRPNGSSANGSGNRRSASPTAGQALEGLCAKAATQQRVRPSDVSRARALQRLAADRAGLATITPAAAAPQRLDRTA
ncbi:DUF721 domain-containing protein [Streptomyces sp. NPDC058011]|uniref:DUF721 domain-containing protein n=1 Tax=Streptomyces sp. NPDC058011 TaxID=3346305 RepID=UPI0036E49F5A